MDCTEYLRRENHALKDMVKNLRSNSINRALQGTVRNICLLHFNFKIDKEYHHALKDMVKKGQNRALQGTVENTEKKFKETIYDFIQI